MATKILFAPSQSREILDIAEAITPPGFELAVVDHGTPEFYKAAADAEYFLGLARQMGGEFFRSAPKLRLVQLLSAGYDRVDVEAARKAKVPVANNGGANAIAVAEHTVMLMLAVAKRLVRFHIDVVAGKWRAGGCAGVRAGGQDARHRRARQHRQEGGPPRRRLRHGRALLRHQAADGGCGGRLRRALPAARRAPAHRGRREPPRAARRHHAGHDRGAGARDDEAHRHRHQHVPRAGRSTRTPSTRRWWMARSPGRGSTCSWTSRRRPGIRSSRSRTSRSRPTRRAPRGRTGRRDSGTGSTTSSALLPGIVRGG